MRERDIFIEALECDDPAARAALLDNACQNDAELRSRVERLLAENERQESFILDIPPSALNVTVDQPIAERPGTVIGPYKLLQQIGEGGMGVVFMAQQTSPLERTVALKIIKTGMDSRQVISRFEAERQALAMMDHPNIAKVFDGGATGSGQPYFVMELVKGVPITNYCDEKHLTVRQRLELFVSVCQAVQHAHQKGIIHRDLKPSNVLVAEYDEHAVPKVIDFGVAKATAHKLTERTLFTEFGQMIGTMEYMSPEQAKLNQLDIDTRSDIYSLGVLLYELLTGSTPIEGKRLHNEAFDEMLRIVREEDPPKPSTRLSTTDQLPSIAANRSSEPKQLSGIVRGELDWIVMKSLEKDRNRRYNAASGFAADIQRLLHDEPVEAGPPSAAYRFRKLVKRNKGLMMAVSLTLLTLAVGIVGTSVGLIRAEQSRQAEVKQRQAAMAREAETRAILDFLQAKILAAAGPVREDGGLGREVTLRQAIEAALPFLEASFADQPLIEARLRMTLGTTFLNLGEAETAEQQFQRARLLRAESLGANHPDTLECMNNLATAYADLGRYADALHLNERTLELRKLALGPDHPDTLNSMANLSFRYYQLGRYADSLALSEETLTLMKAKLGSDDPATLRQMIGLAVSYASLGRDEDALRLREEALSMIRSKLGADSEYAIAGLNNLANSYAVRGRHGDALKLREEVLSIRKDKLGADHPLTLRSMENLALSYTELRQFAEARKLYEQTLSLMTTRLGPAHPVTLGLMYNFACMHALQGEKADALKLYQETLVLSQDKLGKEHPDTLKLQWGMAAMLVELGRSAEAAPIIEECLRCAEKGNAHPEMGRALIRLRIRHFQEMGDEAGCRETAEMYESYHDLPLAKPGELYDAACLRAVTATVIEHKGETPDGSATHSAVEESDRAMAWLQQAVQAGFSDVRHMRDDADLATLRNRDDFKQVVARLETNANTDEPARTPSRVNDP